MLERPDDTSGELAGIRNQVAHARELIQLIAGKEEELKGLRDELHQMTRVQLPELFSHHGMTELKLEAQGNYPAILATRKRYYRASIAASWEDERRAAAYRYLEDQGAGDLIKTSITVTLPKDSVKQRKLMLDFLKKFSIPFVMDLAVPWASLTAWLRKEVEQQRFPKLDAIGGEVGEVVTLEQPKESTRRAT